MASNLKDQGYSDLEIARRLLEYRLKDAQIQSNRTLHSVPLRVLDENKAKEVYAELLKNVKHYNMQAWLDTVQNGFSESS